MTDVPETVALDLANVDVHMKTSWTVECIRHLRTTRGPAVWAGMDVPARRNALFEEFLQCDLSVCGRGGVLPRGDDATVIGDVRSGEALRAGQRVAVQVNEVIDVNVQHGARAARARGDEPAPPRTNARLLKLFLVDGGGGGGLVAFEREPIAALRADAPAGLKLMLLGPIEMRHGVLLLDADAVRVLGGVVERLETLRVAAVNDALAKATGKKVSGATVTPTARTAAPVAGGHHLQAIHVGAVPLPHSAALGQRGDCGGYGWAPIKCS